MPIGALSNVEWMNEVATGTGGLVECRIEFLEVESCIAWISAMSLKQKCLESEPVRMNL